MAIVYMDGMDCYDAWSDFTEAGWLYTTGYSPTVLPTGGRFGDVAMRPWNDRYGYRADSTSGTEIGIQGAYLNEYVGGASTGYLLLYAKNNSRADMCFSLYVNSGGAIILKNSTGATVGTSASGVIIQDQWHYIEVWATINNGAGTLLVKVDGATIFDLTSQDTAVSATDVDGVYFCSGTSTYGRWDDIVILDGTGSENNDLLGDCRIYTGTVDADSAQEDWDLSTGSDSYALIDDTIPGDHDGDSTYIEDDTVGGKTLCEVEDFVPADCNPIYAVAVVMALRKTDAGSRTARSVLKSNATEANGTEQYPATTWQTYRDYHELDPDGDIAWTVAKVNASLIGPEIVS